MKHVSKPMMSRVTTSTPTPEPDPEKAPTLPADTAPQTASAVETQLQNPAELKTGSSTPPTPVATASAKAGHATASAEASGGEVFVAASGTEATAKAWVQDKTEKEKDAQLEHDLMSCRVHIKGRRKQSRKQRPCDTFSKLCCRCLQSNTPHEQT